MQTRKLGSTHVLLNNNGTPASKYQGKSMLTSSGYEQAANPLYWRKGQSIIHWNSISKCWIVEGG